MPAGEDDLDAPDLLTPMGQTAQEGNGKGRGSERGGNGSGSARSSQRPAKNAPVSVRQALSPDESALQRDLILSDLATVESSDAAALWAQRIMATKNSLTAGDAARVEAAFHAKLSTLEADNADVAGFDSAHPPRDLESRGQTLPAHGSTVRAATQQVSGIDKSALAFPEPRRIRDKEHLKFVATQPCLICGRKPCDPHHLRLAQAQALGRKTSDEFTVPLCRGHHRELHRSGNEAAWWKQSGVDPMPAARILWLKTHPMRDEAALTRREVSTEGNGAMPDRAHRSRSSGKRRRNSETKPIVTDGRPRTLIV